jgi:hypothetical protein
MSNEENWRLQVSFKTPAGTLINVRAVTGAELGILLGDISDEELATQISSVESKLGLAHTLAPLGITPSTAAVTPAQSSQAGSVAPASGTSVPPATCIHGPRKLKQGLSGPKSKVPGTPYSMWVCQQPQGPNQCPPMN